MGIALLHPEIVQTVCEASGQLPTLTFKGIRAPAGSPDLHAFHGGSDDHDPLREGERTVDLFKKAGFNMDLKVKPGVAHEFPPMREDIDACLQRALKIVTGK